MFFESLKSIVFVFMIRCMNRLIRFIRLGINRAMYESRYLFLNAVDFTL